MPTQICSFLAFFDCFNVLFHNYFDFYRDDLFFLLVSFDFLPFSVYDFFGRIGHANKNSLGNLDGAPKLCYTGRVRRWQRRTI